MPSGTLSQILLFGPVQGTKEYVEFVLKKDFQKGVWRTNTNVSYKKWAVRAKNITAFIDIMNKDRKIKSRPKSKGAFVYEIRGFSSYNGVIFPHKFYRDKLRGRTPLCCLIRDWKGEAFSLLVTLAKLPEEWVVIGTSYTYNPDEDRRVENCLVPLIFVRNEDGTYESINQF